MHRYRLRHSRPELCGGEASRYGWSMQLVINAQEQTVDDGLSLAQLVQQLGMKPDRVAVELNRSIVPRQRWAETLLRQDDRLEIVHFVGGG